MSKMPAVFNTNRATNQPAEPLRAAFQSAMPFQASDQASRRIKTTNQPPANQPLPIDHGICQKPCQFCQLPIMLYIAQTSFQNNFAAINYFGKITFEQKL